MQSAFSKKRVKILGELAVGVKGPHSCALSTALKTVATAAIDGGKRELSELSNELWKNPELALEERKAHDLLTTFLEKKGFIVDRSYTGIETAFRATFGSGRPNVCVICEYDALPEIGHACGHNLIAEAGVAAGLGLKAALEASGAPQARITILGTPAEEGIGGKVYLIENGAFEDIDIAMMVHPAPVEIVKPAVLALTQLQVTYHGKAAHAAAFPWEGVNALDAAVIAYTSISALRQQMKPTWRVHGIFTNGGVKPNIIPDTAELLYYIRAPTAGELALLKAKVVSCFQAAAKATGCRVDIVIPGQARHYLEIINNPTIAEVYAANLKALGVNYNLEGDFPGSTDMGNVSYVVPSIHPVYTIGSGKAVNHTVEFTSFSNTPEAHEQTLTAAKAMAHTSINVLTTNGALEKIQEEFIAAKAKCPPDALALVAQWKS